MNGIVAERLVAALGSPSALLLIRPEMRFFHIRSAAQAWSRHVRFAEDHVHAERFDASLRCFAFDRPMHECLDLLRGWRWSWPPLRDEKPNISRYCVARVHGSREVRGP
jgi:hypothetical protein